MTDAKQSKLDDLNGMLIGVENQLLHRALRRDRGELDNAVDFINDMAEKDMIDISCAGSECAGGEDGGEEAEINVAAD